MTDIYCRLHESDLVLLTDLTRSEIIVYLHFKVNSMASQFQKAIKFNRSELEIKLKLSRASVNRALKKLVCLGLIGLTNVQEKIARVFSLGNSQLEADEQIEQPTEVEVKVDNNKTDEVKAPEPTEPLPQPNATSTIDKPISSSDNLVMKKEKPRVPEHQIINRLKVKLQVDYHPYDVLKSVTGCLVYSDKKGSLVFQSKVTDEVLFRINAMQLLQELPAGCDSQGIRACLDSIKR